MFVFAAGNGQDYGYPALSHFLDEEPVVIVMLFGDS